MAERAAVADTDTDRTANHSQSLLVNPLAPAVGLAVSQQIAPAFSINLRYQRSNSERIGLTVAPQYSYVNFFGVRNHVLAVKCGPRISLSRRRWARWKRAGSERVARPLAGWYVFPSAILGWAWTSQLGQLQRTTGIAGLGAEIGRAWHWRRLVLELGVGAHYTGYVAHYSPLSGAAGDPPAAGFGPIVNFSIGYRW